MSYQSIRLVDENKLEEALSECGGGSMITITDITSEGDYEDETVTVSVGTYSKTAIIEDGTATIKGFTETGTVTVSVSDFTKTFNIDKYSKYEVGVGNVDGFYEQWLNSINEPSTSYSSLADVLADEKMVRELFTRHASVDFLVSNVGNYPEELETIINNDYCAKWINLRDYALDTLYANQLIASLMDQADKYFYGEWTIVDGSTTPPTWGPKGNVPVMTSDTAPYGTAVGSTGYDGAAHNPWKAFDGAVSGGWNTVDTAGEKNCGYKFANPVCIKKVKIWLPTNGTYRARNCAFTVQVSNDNVTWNDLYDGTIPSGTSITTLDFNINNDNYYLYYRLHFESGQYMYGNATLYIHEIQFYGRELKVSVPTMTSNTTPYGEASASKYASDNSLPYKAFVYKTDSGGWYTSRGSSMPQWIMYDFKKPVHIMYMLLSANWDGIPHEYKLEGSTDGTSWDTLGNFNNTVQEPHIEFNKILSAKKYSKYKVTILSFYRGTASADYCSIKYLNFYGLDYYSEYDWDTDNPRHYIYDHGVELEDLTLVGSVSKDSDCLKLIAANDQVSKILDTTDYTLLRGVVGSNASGTNVLLCGSGSATFTADSMPYNQSLDISSINSTNATGVKQTAAGTFDAAEIWLE